MGKLKLLLVDDEEDFLIIMGETIKSWGYEVEPASGGPEAIEAVKKKSADIVILDYKMPDMDGTATFKEIRKIDAEIPIIMFSAYPDKGLEGTEDLDACVFVPKHCVISDVEASLKGAINIAKKKLKKAD